MTRPRTRRVSIVATLTLLMAALLISCGRENTAPASSEVALFRRGLLSFEPVFPSLVGGKLVEDVVQFEKVRVVLRRADGTIALDSTVLFPVGADSVLLAASVPLSPTAGSGGENFKLDLDYKNAAGETVFKGGPVDVTVAPKGSSSSPPAPVQIPVRYAGPGATATKVTILAPRAITVSELKPFAFSAVATDAAGNTLTNTPIVWASLQPTIAVLSSISAGTGQSLSTRGTARIVAQLLTGQADTATVTVSLSAKTIAAQSGNDQKGIVRSALAQPVAVKVTAGDGVGVPGVAVTFAIGTGGGSVASSSVPTDANGVATTTWTLGEAVGEQTLTAAATGLAGSPVTFKATARSVAPTKLVIATGPGATVGAGTPIPLVVHALDAQGDVAKSFTGAVTVALGAGSPAATLLGTATMNAVEGVATFSDVRINVVGSGYVLAASATGLQGANTSAFAVTPGPAQRMEFAAYPLLGSVAGLMDVVTVQVRDAAGNLATGFTGTITVSLAQTPGGTLGGTLTRSAVAGIATFDNLVLTMAGAYQLGASSTGMTTIKGPSFTVSAGTAAKLVLISGSGQVAEAGSLLPKQILVGLADRYDNSATTSGVSVAFVAGNGGSASPSSTTTNSFGQASASWTLGSATGVQTLTVSSGSLGTLSVTADAFAPAKPVSGGAGDLILIDDVNAFDNSYGTPNAGNVQFIKNLVSFSHGGSRATATKVLAINDRNHPYDFSSNFSQMKAIFEGLGFTTRDVSGPSAHSALVPVASDVKLVIINNPLYTFSATEINGLKSFASQGGRILLIGEHGTYYAETYRSGVQNPLLAALGSSITVKGDCGIHGFITTVAHQVTSGVASSGSGSIFMACASYHIGHGARDTEIGKNASGRVVLSAVTVNTTPVSLPSLRAIVAPGDPAPRTLVTPDGRVARPKRAPR